jgi:RNA polymerase sigma-70 factor, ECF subfamily
VSAVLSDIYSRSDAGLVALARAGSPVAFEAIVMRYRVALVHHCARVLGDADAEEAVQEALVKANQALLRGEEVRALEPWLHTIAHRVALNLLRARASRPSYARDRTQTVVHLEDYAEQRQRVREVLEAVQSLPLRQRKALLMLVIEGRSYEEIAVLLGATPRAVGQLLNRARQALQQQFGAL